MHMHINNFWFELSDIKEISGKNILSSIMWTESKKLEETDLKQFFSWVEKVQSGNVWYLGDSADAAAAAEAVAAVAVVAAVADVPVGAVDVVEEDVAVFLAVVAAAADVDPRVAVAVAWPWGMMAF